MFILQNRKNEMGKEIPSEFKDSVLLMIALLKEDAYGLGVGDKLKSKGFAASCLGDPTKERAGRGKRLFSLTAFGKKALVESRDTKVSIWTQILELSFKTI